MRANEIVDKFHRLGYSLSLDGDNIRFKFTGNGVPLRGDVQPLLDFLRQNKEAVVAFLRQPEIEPVGSNPEPDDERFSNAFRRVVEEMSAGYKSGFFDRARLQRPRKFSQFAACEGRVSKYWDEGNYEGFLKGLRDWQDFYRSMSASFGSGNRG